MKNVKRKENVKIKEKYNERLKNRFNDISCRMCMASPYMYMTTTDEYINMDNDYLVRYIEKLRDIYLLEDVDLEKEVSELLDDKEIMGLLYMCYEQNKSDFWNDKRLILWLVSAGQITYLLRLYKKMKNIVNGMHEEKLLKENQQLNRKLEKINLELQNKKCEIREYKKANNIMNRHLEQIYMRLRQGSFEKTDILDMKYYKVNIDNEKCTKYFITNASYKVTKLLLTLWFTNINNSKELDSFEKLFEEFGYTISEVKEIQKDYMCIDLN